MTGIYYSNPASLNLSQSVLEVRGFIFASRNSLAISKWLTKKDYQFKWKP